MSRERFIAPEFWSDPKVGKLSPLERLLFIGCFSNADDEGRLPGNPAWLRATILPYDEVTPADVQKMRDHLVSLFHKLVLYEVDGDEYLAFLNWDKYQKPKYKRPSKIPAPPVSAQSLGRIREESAGICAEPAGNRPCGSGSGSGCGSGVDVVGDVEGCGEPTTTPFGAQANLTAHEDEGESKAPEPSPDVTPAERELLAVLKAIPGYPFDYSTDLRKVREWAVDFPAVDLIREAKSWSDWLSNPRNKVKNYRLAFRHWLEVASKPRARGTGPPQRTQARAEPKAWATLRRMMAEEMRKEAVPNDPG